jgi:hypothetical protein
MDGYDEYLYDEYLEEREWTIWGGTPPPHFLPNLFPNYYDICDGVYNRYGERVNGLINHIKIAIMQWLVHQVIVILLISNFDDDYDLPF